MTLLIISFLAYYMHFLLLVDFNLGDYIYACILNVSLLCHVNHRSQNAIDGFLSVQIVFIFINKTKVSYH